MMQGNTIIIALVALIFGFGAGLILRPVIAPTAQTMAVTRPILTASPEAAPRATQYFAAHLDEARKIVAGCQAGSVRGDECTNAGQAVTEAEGKARFKKFMGN